MIELKSRSESEELFTLRSLQSRTVLAEKEKLYYILLEKGFEWETQFDQRVASFPDDWQFVHDVLLEQNNTFFQLDSLGLCGDRLYLFEVKNYEGDFVVEGEKWKSSSGHEIKNPLHQLQRCESLLKRFLHEKGIQASILPYLIFINPRFTLYQAPLHNTLIFPTQLDSFFKNLREQKSVKTTKQAKIANLLLSAHKTSYPNPFLPTYRYEDLTKGMVCAKCGEILVPLKRKRRINCSACGEVERLEDAIVRSAKEFSQLFPERRVTASEIFAWCGETICKKTITRTLARNCKVNGRMKSTHYEL